MNRFLPLASFAVAAMLIGIFSSCAKQEDKAPQSAEQKVENAMQGQQQAAQSADTSKSGTTMTLSDKAKKGQAIFYNTSFGKFKASCAMCHSDGTDRTKDGKTRAGHTLAGVTSRTTTWNGMFKTADLKKDAYGARLCASGFLERGDGDMAKALSADEADALNEYFAAIADAPGAIKKNLTIQWVLKPVFSEDQQLDEKLTKPAVKAIMKLPGDPAKGQTVWQGTCVTCHDLQQKKVGPSMAEAAKDMNYVAQSIRCGSMAMPFFAKDILSDQQIADVIAYVQSSIKK
ncbi:MAG: c-type cytochrome [Bacteroidetes bacterium]|nr:c-type cytochrome [Bacteroidota bacterium]